MLINDALEKLHGIKYNDVMVHRSMRIPLSVFNTATKLAPNGVNEGRLMQAAVLILDENLECDLTREFKNLSEIEKESGSIAQIVIPKRYVDFFVDMEISTGLTAEKILLASFMRVFESRLEKIKST
jgi:hypothetical protein